MKANFKNQKIRYVIILSIVISSHLIFGELFGQDNCENVQIIAESDVVNVTCYGGDDGVININAKGGSEPYQFSIDNGQTFSSNNVFNNLEANDYQVMITDTSSCIEVIDIEVEEPAYYEIDLGPNIKIFSNQEITIDAGSSYEEYQWSTGEQTQKLVFKREVNLITEESVLVEVYDKNGCFLNSTTLSITIEPRNEQTQEYEPDQFK